MMNRVKTTPRVILGILGGLIVLALGIHQIVSGVKEMSGTQASKRSQSPGDRVTVSSQGCSLRVPRGWEQKGLPQRGVLFKAPAASGYVANIIVGGDPFNDTLRKYVDATIESVKASAPGARFDRVNEFSTASGEPACKVTLHNKSGDLELLQTMYFFNGLSGRKIVVTTTCPAANAADLSPLFDICMKSLMIAVP